MPEDVVNRQSELLENLEIRRAQKDDLQAVWGIIRECSDWLVREYHLRHWADHYTEDMMGKMIAHKEVYLAEANGIPVSTMTFDSRPPKYYQEEGYDKMFEQPEEPAGYVMAVGVLPEYQGQGVAVQMIKLAEEESRNRGLKWLRLDCRNEVPGLVSFYEKRGFTKVGDEALKEGDNESYWLMEKSVQ